jgi:hypothetical protein
MATTEEVLAVLEVCGRAYPNYPMAKATAEIYVRSLSDIPGGLLRQAAERHIDESIFFPRIAELRGMAARLAGTPRFNSLAREPNQDLGVLRQTPRSETDELAYQAQALEEAFTEERRLDPAGWLALAEAFELAGRSHRAEYTRGKLAGLQAVLEQEQTAEQASGVGESTETRDS